MARYPTKSWRAFRPDSPRGEAAAEPVRTRAAGVGASAACALAVTPVRCRILGIDPGSHRTGFGVIDCNGPDYICIAQGHLNVTRAELASRLRDIHCGVLKLIETHAPDEVAVERVFVNRNIDSALKLGQARGAALAAVPAHIPVAEYAPRAIKMAAVGFGGADKIQVAHMVRQLLHVVGPLSADAADALAVAICHANGRRAAAWVASAGPRA